MFLLSLCYAFCFNHLTDSSHLNFFTFDVLTSVVGVTIFYQELLHGSKRPQCKDHGKSD